ncbi:MAG: carbohydrate binding family 9 domain-containing protein [Bacteroidales bacterium]|nr:carbohydrate binding family 9 domain-containing protein [Bacteroidales bacterium]
MTKQTGIILLFLFMLINNLLAQDHKTYNAQRSDTSPVIDGHIEKLWLNAPEGGNFWMHEPYNHRRPRFETKFRVLYNNDGLYIACTMKDPRPDSIMSELGVRDEFSYLNADHISIDIFPFNDGLNGNAFKLTPDNLQADEKYSASGVDQNWDAVWESSTAITDSSWNAEIYIPWSALRFPKKQEQEWGFMVWRHIRRYREWDTWTEMDKNTGNIFTQYGTLTNISDIDPPLRLSVMPYLSGYADFHKNETTFSYNGGLDLKYGFNESFTLDMTLIPDFGQVLSDDIVLNLTPYEIQYDEKRQFFTEGTELFSKGDIFYSRRIGDEPVNYKKVNEQLDSGEVVTQNPDKTQLINATKISGRTPGGLGIGIFNAMTSNTYAEVKDIEGNKSTILTQPFTNYNMLVLDQNLPNNSYLALVNTNVSMFKTDYYANVSGIDFNVKNKQQKYSIGGDALISQKYRKLASAESGYKYEVDFKKIKGDFIFELERKTITDKYDPNDMGYLSKNNYSINKLELKYRILNPRGIILNWKHTLEAEHEKLFKPNRYAGFRISANSMGTFRNHLTVNFYGGLRPVEQHDYYEARVRHTVFDRPPSWDVGFWFSSDYRNSLALDGGMEYLNNSRWQLEKYMFRLEPRIRVSDQFFFTVGSRLEKDYNDYGFVNYQKPDIIFGNRNAQTVTNTITARYIFNVKHNLNFRVRHYWAKVKYNRYYTLQHDGSLAPWQTSNDYNINFNAFNIDLAYNWRFAPGSEMSVVWKNELVKQNNQLVRYYMESLKNIFATNQFNSLSIKILYYLDYNNVRRNLSDTKPSV